jgi:flagellar basal-body rod modification protein FlgD
MPIGTIGQTPPAAASSQTSISQEDFLKILTTQLSFQDPLKPMDNQQFMAQMAQFAGLEQSRQTNSNIETMLQMQAAAQSIGLIGREVELSAASGLVVGTVTTVRFVNGNPLVSLQTNDGQFLTDQSMGSISAVREPRP